MKIISFCCCSDIPVKEAFGDRVVEADCFNRACRIAYDADAVFVTPDAGPDYFDFAFWARLHRPRVPIIAIAPTASPERLRRILRGGAYSLFTGAVLEPTVDQLQAAIAPYESRPA